MGFPGTLLAFIVTIGILVTIHEWGHFIVARMCGVKVIRFSIGFGPILFGRKDRHGTDFCVSAIPLGGYVKMLGEGDDNVGEKDLPFAFNRKPAWQRMAIVSAGPAINLLFALLVFWGFYSLGTTWELAPVVGETIEGSPASRAGLPEQSEIVAVDGKSVSSWSQVTYALVNRVGDSGEIVLGLARGTERFNRPVPIENWLSGEEPGDIVAQLGLVPWVPERPAIADDFIEDSPAKAAGMEKGDQIVAIDGRDLGSWQEMAEIVQSSAGKEIELTVLRGEQLLSVRVVPLNQDGNGKLGIYGPKLPADILREKNYSVLEAFPVAWRQTASLVEMALVSLVKMVQGKLGIDNLSGPITIAKVAGESANQGVQSFIQFLAFFSVMLGVLNLLPIPALDGGHLVFYTWEALVGKAVPDAVQHYALITGLAILVSLMAVAIYNDVMRL